MVLFQKKRPTDSPRLPELPKLEFPSYEQQVKPLYREERPELSELKQIIRDTREENDIPVRKIIPQQGMERPVHTRTFDVKEEKPLFVKIDKYKEAVNDLEHIKNRLREAEHLLDEIDRIRNEENKELESWRVEINKAKEKLLDIDRKLFEV